MMQIHHVLKHRLQIAMLLSAPLDTHLVFHHTVDCEHGVRQNLSGKKAI